MPLFFSPEIGKYQCLITYEGGKTGAFVPYWKGDLIGIISVEDSLANVSQNSKYSYLDVSREMYKQIVVAVM